MQRRFIIGVLALIVAVVLGTAIGDRLKPNESSDGHSRTALASGGAEGASAELGHAPRRVAAPQKNERAATTRKGKKTTRQDAAAGGAARASASPATEPALTQKLQTDERPTAEAVAQLVEPRTGEARATASRCIDDGPPGGQFVVRLCLTAPVDPTFTGDVTVAAEAEVLSGTNPRVRRMVFYLDGAPLLTDFTAPYEFILPSTKWADGNYLLEVEDLTRYVDPVTLQPFTTARASMAVTFANGNAEAPTNTNVFTPTQGREPGPGDPFVVVATGDGASGEPGADAVADMINSLDPNLFLFLGDVYEDGTIAEFYNWYGVETRWGRFKDVTNPTLGNHEYEPDPVGYFDYWGNVPHFYSFDTQGWHFIALDSSSNFGQEDPGSPQYDWLAADLAANTATCTVAFLHHPRFSIGTQGDRPKIDAIWRLLVDSGVDILLTGHDHNYQRWVGLNADGVPDVNGATQFVIGSGGHGIRPFDAARVGDERVAAATDAPGTFGALQLVLGPTGAEFAYITAAGATLDQGSLACNAPTSRAQLRSVAHALSSLIPTGSNSTDDTIEKAIEHLDKADANDQWDTDDRPREDDGKVLDEIKKAAKELEDISSPGPGVTSALDSLQRLGRDVTHDAIAEAEAAAGLLEELGKAYEEREEADEHADDGNYEKELDKLKKAFEHARKALEEAPDPWTSGVGMRGRIGDAIVALRAPYPTGTSADDKIEHADKKLLESLALERWDDDVRPSDDKGQEVMDRLKAALGELEDAKPRTPDVRASLDEIVAISHDLALVAIDEAIDAAADRKDIEDAQEELAKGDAELADGEYEKAADKYKRAFNKARDAL